MTAVITIDPRERAGNEAPRRMMTEINVDGQKSREGFTNWMWYNLVYYICVALLALKSVA